VTAVFRDAGDQARGLDVDVLVCRLHSVAYLRGEAGCAGRLVDVDRGAHARAELFCESICMAVQTQLVVDWRRVFAAWQELLEAVPVGRPLLTNLTATHHWFADRLEIVHDEGDLWATVLLPCRDCGVVFETRRRGGRYRRSCGKCRAPLGLALLEHGDLQGRGLQRGGLVYPRWHPSSPLKCPDAPVEHSIAVVSVKCAHPGCDRTRVTPRRDVRYCDVHAGSASRVARHRQVAVLASAA
jgi:hypothetical protein